VRTQCIDPLMPWEGRFLFTRRKPARNTRLLPLSVDGRHPSPMARRGPCPRSDGSRP